MKYKVGDHLIIKETFYSPYHPCSYHTYYTIIKVELDHPTLPNRAVYTLECNCKRLDCKETLWEGFIDRRLELKVLSEIKELFSIT